MHRQLLRIAAVAAALSFDASAATAACDPDACDADFDCGFRACDGGACASFFADAGTTCRAAAGQCDVEETCDGHSFACPADQKSTDVCRAAAVDCDGTETCNGSDDDCPADVGLAPSISRISVFDRVIVSGDGTPGNARELAIEITGSNLCEIAVDLGPVVGQLVFGDAGHPHDRASARLAYTNADTIFGSTTFSYNLNLGGGGGDLAFVPGPQSGYVDVVSPENGATVGTNPSFGIANACLSCDFIRLEIRDEFGQPLTETFTAFDGPPIDGSAVVGLDAFSNAPPGGLADGEYTFAAEGVNGERLDDVGFEGDASGLHFTYSYGSSVVSEIGFDVVPEPTTVPSLAAAFVALVGARGVRRRRR